MSEGRIFVKGDFCEREVLRMATENVEIWSCAVIDLAAVALEHHLGNHEFCSPSARALTDVISKHYSVLRKWCVERIMGCSALSRHRCAVSDGGATKLRISASGRDWRKFVEAETDFYSRTMNSTDAILLFNDSLKCT
jgi:hypothetical protein